MSLSDADYLEALKSERDRRITGGKALYRKWSNDADGTVFEAISFSELERQITYYEQKIASKAGLCDPRVFIHA